MKIRCFRPVIDENCNVLILGTMPGKQSLEKNYYYANSKNHFWDFIYRILNSKCDSYNLVLPASSTERYRLLLENNIAIWDVLERCIRSGSSDKNIKEAICNDFIELFKNYPQIRTVLFNGGQAHKIFWKNYSPTQFRELKFHKMNSTSSGNYNNTFEILKEWKEVLK